MMQIEEQSVASASPQRRQSKACSMDGHGHGEARCKESTKGAVWCSRPFRLTMLLKLKLKLKVEDGQGGREESK